jgi:2-succinyl-6-hydroxy-2,4-cyclohexadiene-1-carboxylate synthase
VALHGFTGDGIDFTGLAEALSERTDALGVTALDLPGHGMSSAEPGACDFDQQVAEIVDVLAIEARHSAPLLLGYSMGARLALAAALAPNRGPLRGLVLVSGHPGLRTDEERRARRDSDEAWARLLETEGTAAFLTRWQQQPLLAPQLALPEASSRTARRAHALPAGLAASLRGAGTHAMADLRPQLAGLTLPVLVVTGDDDAKFTALGDELMASLPNATRCRLPCGHAPHLEAEEALADAILAFDEAL